MRPPAWVPVPDLAAEGYESPYVLWALRRPDIRPAAAPRKLLRTADLLASPYARVLWALADDLKRWGLAIPRDLLDPSTLRPDLRDPPQSGQAAATSDLGPALPADAVFVCVIDDAIAFAHERFRTEGKTRIDYLWLQGATAAGDAPFGRQLNGPEIDASMRESGFDEDEVYRRFGLVDRTRPEMQREAQRASHGTAMLDIAAGAHPSAPAGHPLALVSMPHQASQDTSGTFAGAFIISGILSILEHVARRSVHDTKLTGETRNYPVVINLSFGLTAGPKDGRGEIEDFLHRARAAWDGKGRSKLRFVLPAGNHRLARAHARLSVPLEQEDPPLFWNLAPDDRTPSFVEAWGAPRQRPPQPGFTVAVQPPGFPDPVRLTPSAFDCAWKLCREDGRLLMVAWFQWRPDDASKPDGLGRERVMLAAPPTAPDESGAQPVTPGPWRLLAYPVADGDRASWPIDLHIQRDDSIPGFRTKGRQSRFIDERYQAYDPSGRPSRDDSTDIHVRRSGTLSAYACSGATIVVGGCYAKGRRAADYSGEGFEGGGNGQSPRRPDVMAPSDTSRARPGVITAGTRSGSLVRVSGTSVAAPAVARALAERMRPAYRSRAAPDKETSAQEIERLFACDLKPDPDDASNPPTFVPVSKR